MKKLLFTSLLLSVLFLFGASALHAEEDIGVVVMPRRYAEITQPKEDAKRAGDVAFRAYLMDDDYDEVQWAVRAGTCARQTNTVMGNVDGFNDSFKWKQTGDYKYNFVAKADTSAWDAGMYCFVFNPVEDPGEADIRLTREFYIAAGRVNGGGVLLEPMEVIDLLRVSGEKPKPEMKDSLMVTFSGNAWDLGAAGYMGNVQFKLHNVGDDMFDKGRFKSTEITDMTFFPGDSATCTYAMNMTMTGLYNGMPGYSAIYRAGDGGEHMGDTARFELYKDGVGLVYDTHSPGEFSDESSCVGTARTGVDKGNVKIQVF